MCTTAECFIACRRNEIITEMFVARAPKAHELVGEVLPMKRLNIEISKMCFQAFYGKNGPSLLGFSFRNAVFFYTSGVTVGLVACLLILVFILYRLIPMVSSCFVSNNSRLKTNTCMCHSGLKKKKKKKKKENKEKGKKKGEEKKRGKEKGEEKARVRNATFLQDWARFDMDPF